MSKPDPDIYGSAWRSMDEAPGGWAVLLLVPNRPDLKVVAAVRVGPDWVMEHGHVLPDDQPPIGWMYNY